MRISDWSSDVCSSDLLLGVVVLGIALVVSDVISALTLAYNLLVGGMLIPLIGAIYWKRATTAGAITSMSLGFLTALFFMIKDGMDANTPIYYSLSVALVSFVVVSLLSPRSKVVAKRSEEHTSEIQSLM